MKQRDHRVCPAVCRHGPTPAVRREPAGPPACPCLSPPEVHLIAIPRLEELCRRDFDSFTEFGAHHPTPRDRGYFFHDAGHPVLGVAHLDTVLPGDHFEAGGGRVHSPALDDRLGVYILTHLLPALGVAFDLLLTDAEEVGRSTAAHFVPPRRYNWVFSFDRAGTDAVLYQYDCPDLRRRLEGAGSAVGRGSRSDISHLEHLGCKGLNLGCGYYRAHRPDCFARTDETIEMARRFAGFWREHRHTHLPHDADRV